ncbi:MAG: hypothetical protein ABIO39_12140, partial [Caulobacteraceae bacterium]
AMEAAEDAVLRRDPGTTRAMLSAARSGLGLIAERYGDPELARDLAAIRDAATDLGQLQDRLSSPSAAARVRAWAPRLNALEARLRRDEDLSLFNRRRLADLTRAEGPSTR